MKGFISIEILLGFVIVFLMFTGGVYLVMRDNINSMPSDTNPMAVALAQVIPFAFLIAIVIGIFIYAFGMRRMPRKRGG